MIWKTTGRSGTAKVKSFPCYCCAVTTSSLVAAQPKEKCFRAQQCLQPLCFYYSMICGETIQNWEVEKQELEQQYGYVLPPTSELNKSQVTPSLNNELHDDQNPYDIDYQPSTLEEGIECYAFLNTGLGYRQLPYDIDYQPSTLEEGIECNAFLNTGKRQRLHSTLEAEQIYGLMMKLVRSMDSESAICTVDDAIPFIMHGGRRINEKLFMMVLLEAGSSCMTNQE